MSSIIRAQNVESSKREHPGKCEQTTKLMLICSDVPKKAITEIHILGTVRSPK